MSVDGHLIADVQRLRRLGGKSLFLLVTGGKGSGKSTALRAFCTGLAAATPVRHASSLQSCCQDASEAAATDDIFTLWTVDYGSVAATGAVLDSSTTCTRPTLHRHSVFVVDDVDLLWSLCSINGVLQHLQRLLYAALTSPSCALVASAPSHDGVPSWLTIVAAPVLYPLHELTEASMRRLLRAVPAAHFKICGEPLVSAQASSSSSRQLLLMNTCMSLEAAANGSDAAALALRAKTGSAFLHHQRNSDRELPSTSRLYGLSEMQHRVETLVSVFAARSSPGGGGRLMASLPSSTGLLLHGPSGCGKSSLARQLAASFPAVPFFFVDCTMLFSKYLGESEEQLREVYRHARARAPAVVVLEDLDVIAQSRGAMQLSGGGDQGGGKGQLDVTKRMLAGLLCELDGLVDNTGVLTIGITNAPHVVDAAVLRQGRLETILYVPPLSDEGAAAMCADFFARFAGDEDARRQCAEAVAQQAVGCAAASLQYVLRRIFESAAALHGWPTADAGELPLPALADVQRHLFESCGALRRAPALTHFE